MSTKTKVVISVFGIVVIIAVIVLSLVLAFTDTAHNIKSSTLVIDYSSGNINAKVNVNRKDVNLYLAEDGSSSTMVDVEELATYTVTSSDFDTTSDAIDLGAFNNGQYLDITKADTTLVIEVALHGISDAVQVSLGYTDLYEKDDNVKLVVNTSLFTSNNTELKLEKKTAILQNGVWDISNLVNSNVSLTNFGYNKMIIEVEAKVVSFAQESCRFDGKFNLSLT